MAKITLENGVTIEGTVEELMAFQTEVEKKSEVETKSEPSSAKQYVKIQKYEAKVGDFIKYEELPDFYEEDLTVGKYYEIVRIDSFNDPQIIDDVSYEYDTSGDYFEVYRKKDGAQPKETITHNGAEYTLVHRKAQPGDVVVFTENTSNYYINGKVYGPVNAELEVPDKDGCRFDVYALRFNRTVENVKVYEPKQAALRVGDYAKLKSISFTLHGFSEGEIVTLHENTVGNSDFKVVSVAGGNHGYTSILNLVKATDAEVAAAKAEAEKKAEEVAIAEKFAKLGRKPNEVKIGDIVKVTTYVHGHSIGTVGEVVRVKDKDEYLNRVDVKKFGGSTWAERNVELIAPVESRVDVDA